MSESFPYPKQEALTDITAELASEHEPQAFIEAVERQYSLAVRTIVDTISESLPYATRICPEAPNDAFWSEPRFRDGQSATTQGRYITLPTGGGDFLVAGYSNRQLTPELPYETATDINYYGTEWEVMIVQPDARLQGMVVQEQVALRYDMYIHDEKHAYAPWLNLRSRHIGGEFATITRNGGAASDNFGEDSSQFRQGIVETMQKLSRTATI